MSRSTRRVASLGAAALAALALSGCAAGFNATTNKPYAPSNGSIANVGDLRIRNVVIVEDLNGDSSLYATVVSIGAPDSLTEVSVHGATSTTLPNGSVTVPPGGSVTLGPSTQTIALNQFSLKPGQVTTVTFRFADAGSVAASALVMTPDTLVTGG